jgi:putative ABC transport system permease protein
MKRSSFTGNMIFEGKRVTLRIDGVQWEEEIYLREHLVLERGSWDVVDDPQFIIISEEMAQILGARIGDRLLVELRTATGQQNVGEFILGAVHFQPALLSTVSAYASLSAVNRLLNIGPDQYMTLGIYLEDLSEIESVAERTYRALQQAGLQMFPRTDGGQGFFPFIRSPTEDGNWQGTRFQLSTLNDYLSQVMQIVSIVDTVSLVVLVVLLFIVTVGIANTFRMIMFERIQEIGTMRALGLQRGSVRALFLLEAFFLCLLGMAAGLAVFGISVLGLEALDWGLDSPMFLFLEAGHLSFRLRGAQAGLSLGLVCFMTVLSAFLPAQAAARLEPVKSLGAEH